MKKAVLLGLAMAIGLGAYAFAADDPSIEGQQRADIKASMAAHIETSKYADVYLIFDAVAGGLKRLDFDHVHDGIVRKGEFFVSCADFYDDAETFNAYMARCGRPESHHIWERQRLRLRQPPKAGSSDLSAQESLRIDQGGGRKMVEPAALMIWIT